MATSLLKVIADLNLSLASAVSVGATTATLKTAVDSDGVALPSGKYGFTVDGDNSSKEFFVCDLNGTALTNVQSISKQGATTTGFSTYHRTGAVITITDWAVLSRVINNLNGTTGFDAGTPLNYDAQPSYSDPLTIPTVQFVLDTANGGAVTFDATVVAGDAGETIASGDWVYFNTADGRWYKTDANDTAKCLNVQIGKARGAGTTGNAISGGVFIDGLEKVGTYVAGTTYYLADDETGGLGQLSTVPGTFSVVVGVGDSNGDLILKKATPNQVEAMVGGGNFGSPSSTNKFITEQYNSGPAGLPVVRTFTTASTAIGSSTTQFDISNPSGTTFRYTWDGTGTNPNITAVTVPTGSLVDLKAQNFVAGNQGIFVVTNSGTNFFEVTNASGVVELNKTIGTGFIAISGTNFWTKPTGLKYAVVEVVGGGGGGGGGDTSGAGNFAGSGGGAGGYAKKLFVASALGATVPYLVGQLGANGGGGATPIAGGDGRTTQFGTLLIATGGTGGGVDGNSGGTGGIGSLGDLNCGGQGGGKGTDADANAPGIGGSSVLGGGGRPVTSGAGEQGRNFGGGGAGGDLGAFNGGSGGVGALIITEYFS